MTTERDEFEKWWDVTGDPLVSVMELPEFRDLARAAFSAGRKSRDAEVEGLEGWIAALREALQKNHEWHQLYDEYDGYPDSELCERNTAALVDAKAAAQSFVDRLRREAAERERAECVAFVETYFSPESVRSGWVKLRPVAEEIARALSSQQDATTTPPALEEK